jgi:hypothetical protein
MEQSPSWETNIHSASQVHRSPPLIPVLNKRHLQSLLMRATCSAPFILLDLTVIIIFVEALQAMKLLIMQSSLASRHFLPLRSKYFPQHPVLKQPQSMLLPQCERPSFTLIQNSRCNYGFVYFNILVHTAETRKQITLNRMIARIAQIWSVS